MAAGNERLLLDSTLHATDLVIAAARSPMIGTLRLCAAYLSMRWGGVLAGNGTRPGDVLNDTDTLARAETLFAPASLDVSCAAASRPGG